MKPALGFMASRCSLVSLLGASLAVLLAAVVTPCDVPTLAMSARQPLAPFAPAVAALAVGLLLDNPMPHLEARTPRRRLYGARVSWYATVLASATATAAAMLPLAAPAWHGIMLRNAVLLTAVAALASVGVGHRAAWLAVLVVALPELLAGVDDSRGARFWAVLVQPLDSMTSALVTAGLAVLALACYTRWDTRPLAGLPAAGA
ncbi:hypothetical protein [Streptomyces sp. NPDC020996]|uniref:hypothetical protein n=1 Tax=Streptomyces sp. NPDC020996 TaxID=3154791 RepID=UPI00340CEC19